MRESLWNVFSIAALAVCIPTLGFSQNLESSLPAI